MWKWLKKMLGYTEEATPYVAPAILPLVGMFSPQVTPLIKLIGSPGVQSLVAESMAIAANLEADPGYKGSSGGTKFYILVRRLSNWAKANAPAIVPMLEDAAKVPPPLRAIIEMAISPAVAK